MGKARNPVYAPYLGPTVQLEMNPDDLLRQLAYGGRRPMLMPRQKITGLFYLRLLDEMCEHHTALVRCTYSAAGAYKVARQLRAELPAQAFGVHVDYDQRIRMWNVIVYHQVTPEMLVPRMRDERGDIWVDTKEAARALGLSRYQAVRVIDGSGFEVRRLGGRQERQIRQQDLVALSRRPRRWRKRTRKEA